METTNPTPRRFSTEMVEVFNNFLDKIQPALRSGGMTPEERAQLAQLVAKVQTLEAKPTPQSYDDAPLSARVQALEQKPSPQPYDDTELRGKINALELREDKVGVSAEEMGRAITAAIAALPPDEVGISEERVQELIAAIHHYDDTALSGRVQALEEREMPTPYNDTELRGKVVALETLPTGLDALKARVANLEVSAGAAQVGGEIRKEELEEVIFAYFNGYTGSEIVKSEAIKAVATKDVGVLMSRGQHNGTGSMLDMVDRTEVILRTLIQCVGLVLDGIVDASTSPAATEPLHKLGEVVRVAKEQAKYEAYTAPYESSEQSIF